MLKIALVVNEPPPYRIPIFNRIAATGGIQLHVIFCCRREPNRLWDLPVFAFDHVFLRERITTINGRYIHNNPDVLLALSRFNPDVVLGNGFNPTHLYALAWSLLRRKPFVPMTDGTVNSEQALSKWHRRIRQFTYARSASFIAASNGGIALYRSYGIARSRCFKSCLCIDNMRFESKVLPADKAFDFIFCSRIEAVKNPEFALQVAAYSALLLGRQVRMLFVGSGNAENATRALAHQLSDQVDTHFHGFASQKDLPALYQSARIFLFPTHADVWGVVANEACAAGLPVLVSPHAGVAGELIVDGLNGFICPLVVEQWAERAFTLLQDPQRLQNFGMLSRRLVDDYRFDLATQGIIDACQNAQQGQTCFRLQSGGQSDNPALPAESLPPYSSRTDHTER